MIEALPLATASTEGAKFLMEQINLEIPRGPGDSLQITLKKGDQLFIVGANGSGKSALIQHFARHPHEQVKRITAHRQIWFQSGVVEITHAEYESYKRGRPNTNEAGRWVDLGSQTDLSAALYGLFDKENSQAREIRHQLDTRSQADVWEVKELSAKLSSPFNQINELLARGMLTVKIEKTDNQRILARDSQGNSFGIEEMSDGEKNAMIIASQVITADPGTLFLIDEPERHLHRSIIEPFLSALFALRVDCTFIISTHEIALPVANPEARVLMLRSCMWNENRCKAWEAEVLDPNTQLPEDLKLAILGSRKRILFVEGNSSSLDFQLYTALFPNLSVVPKGSCEDVQKAVLGIRGSQDMHHVEAFGLIDRDNRSDEEVKELAKKGIFALEVWSVESLYYCSEAIAAVALRQAESVGADSNEFIKSAKQEAIEELKGKAEHMAARRCERQIREQLLAKVPKLKSIQENPIQQICVSIDSPYAKELERYNNLVEEGKWDQLVARYPLRESRAFRAITKVLKCPNNRDYEAMVIVQIRKNKELAKALKNRIGPLAKELNQA